ncbi:MAG: (4Fe-4S)-binding protein [Desulfobulbaceae bacterium]|nr:MAG: (4Fe-4S)-binding protein [Desulfobulbaceae bacterium]
MKEVVVISGKGGVGKSSITAALASLLLTEKQRIVLADTDVDAPNLNLVLGARLDTSEEIAASAKAFIDPDKCMACMACMDVCRFSAIIGTDHPIIVNYACEGCGACGLVCPEEAISIHEVVNGRLNTMRAGNMLLVAGALMVGASSSGRLVDMVKKRARREAEQCRADLILTDGPPGIGCPVIAAIKGADYVVLITEPTPAALHDLRRVIDVVRHFMTPLGLVINRADLHAPSQRTIRDFALANDYALLGTIPSDQNMTRALEQGRSVVVAYPETPAALALRAVAGALAAHLTALP